MSLVTLKFHLPRFAFPISWVIEGKMKPGEPIDPVKEIRHDPCVFGGATVGSAPIPTSTKRLDFPESARGVADFDPFSIISDSFAPFAKVPQLRTDFSAMCKVPDHMLAPFWSSNDIKLYSMSCDLNDARRERDDLKVTVADQARTIAILDSAHHIDQAEIAKLQAFKNYVHERLDKSGIPRDPYPEKTMSTGCRIEGRLDAMERRHPQAAFDVHAIEREQGYLVTIESQRREIAKLKAMVKEESNRGITALQDNGKVLATNRELNRRLGVLLGVIENYLSADREFQATIDAAAFPGKMQIYSDAKDALVRSVADERQLTASPCS